MTAFIGPGFQRSLNKSLQSVMSVWFIAVISMRLESGLFTVWAWPCEANRHHLHVACDHWSNFIKVTGLTKCVVLHGIIEMFVRCVIPSEGQSSSLCIVRTCHIGQELGIEPNGVIPH